MSEDDKDLTPKGPYGSGSVDSDWTGVSLPIVRELYPKLFAKKLVETQPLSESDYLEGKEKRQYPNKYDDFLDIQSLKWYIVDEIERQGLMVSTLRRTGSISWPLNLRDKDYKYIDDVGFLNIECYSEDLDKRDKKGGCLCGARRDYEMMRISLNPDRWDEVLIDKAIEEIKNGK